MRESVFSVIFKGRPLSISFFSWVKFLLLEIYLGEQLVEMIATTASYNEGDQYHITKQIELGDKVNGWYKPLINFIPSTMINKWLCKSIVQLLKLKYSDHYQLLSKRQVDGDANELSECYGLNHDNIHLLTELKLAYNTVWVTMNIIIDIIVYVCTKDISLTVATGAFIEFIRRFKW